MSSQSKNINSFAENMRKTIIAQTNTLSLLESVQNAISTNDTIVTYDYERLKDGSVNTYQLPSYTAVTNRLKAVENSLNNLSAARSTVTLTDGTRRKVEIQNLPQTPARITSLVNPSTFSLDTNWFFEDLMFPGITISLDLTDAIEDSADRVMVSRIILDATNTTVQQFWSNNLASNDYDYVSLKALLSYNSIAYYEDKETINLPLVSNSLSGLFQVISDPESIDGNIWYTLDTISYSTIDENGADQGVNNVLSIGDRLAYNNTLFSIIDINQSSNKVRLQIQNGTAFPGIYTQFTYYQDPFRSKMINVRFGANEYDIIYVKGVNEDYNLLADNWSNPIKFEANALVKSDDTNMTLKDYYVANVVDWGSQWIAQARENNIMAYNGHVPNTPVLNAADLRVVQINTQINAALDTADIKNMAADIESVRSQISSLKSTIAAQQTDLQTISDATRYNQKQQEIATNTQDLQNLQAQYSSLVNSFQTAVKNNKAVMENPKYHIRGFFPVPLYQYRDTQQKYPEEIIGFDIAYRYICEDNTATQLNTFTYTDTNGNAMVTGTFTDWIIEQSKLKQRVYNTVTNMYEWETENVGDGSEVNINQIDIAISKGEKVEIKARSISEAGYPTNPLKSAWSETITVEFPSNLDTTNSMADLIEEINDDALNLAINNTIDSLGVTTHLSDTIANTNSVSGVYFKHMAENIAYEDVNTSTNQVETVNLQDKISDLEARLALLESYINNQANLM